MPLDISKIRGEVERRLRARGLSTPAWSDEKWVEEVSVDLRSRYLRGTKALRGASFAGVDLHDVDLAEADLSDANLSRANLSGANLSRTNFEGTIVTDMDVTGVNLERAKNLEKAIGRCDWTKAANIEGTIFGIARPFQGYATYRKLVNAKKKEGWTGNEHELIMAASYAWIDMIAGSRPLVHYIIDKLVVPEGKTKAFEVAARLIGTTTNKSRPRNIFAWWWEHEAQIDLLMQGYLYWPEKAEGTKDLFKVGPFSVHNTVNLKGAKLNQIKEILETTAATLEKNCIPDLDKTLYGDVYLVAQIQEAKTLAWYNIKTDKVYLRPTKDDKWNELELMIHELGHRYWNKVASEETKAAWIAWYDKQNRIPAKIPKMGDTYQGFNFTTTTTGQGLTIITILRVEYVTEYTKNLSRSTKTRLECDISTETSSENRTFVWDEQRWGKVQNFPSLYAARNAEECFCETLSFFAMGVLPEKYAAPFRAIWGAK